MVFALRELLAGAGRRERATGQCPVVPEKYAFVFRFRLFCVTYARTRRQLGLRSPAPLSSDAPSLSLYLSLSTTTSNPGKHTHKHRPPRTRDRYAQGATEAILLCVVFGWITTALFKPVAFRSNPLKDVIGYNTLWCVRRVSFGACPQS